MTSTISINNQVLTEQPTNLNESWNDVYTDQTAISGNKQRIQFPSRKRAELEWNYDSPSLVKKMRELADAGESVVYSNSYSHFYGKKVEFSGIITVSPGAYLRGGSGLSSLKIIIEEGDSYSS